MSLKLNFENDIESRENPENGESYSRRMHSDSLPAAADSGSRVTALDRWLARKMLEVVHNPPIVLRLWDGKPVTPPVDSSRPKAPITVAGAMSPG